MGQTFTEKSSVKAPEYTSVEAGNLPLINGQIIYVTDTDLTFTSIGLWMCEDGGWVKT